MMKRFVAVLVAVGLVAGFMTMPVYAQDSGEQQSEQQTNTGIWGACTGADSAVCSDKTEATDIVKRLINTFLFVIGMLAVIMVIHSGFKYVTSRGDAEGVKSAKNTLLYAVIGLVVALMAYAIVNFVIEEVG